MKGHVFDLINLSSNRITSCILDFLHFRKFRLVIPSTRGVVFTLLKPCLHLVGRWQTVQTQIRRHINTVASDQIMSSSRGLKWETPFDMKVLT